MKIERSRVRKWKKQIEKVELKSRDRRRVEKLKENVEIGSGVRKQREEVK